MHDKYTLNQIKDYWTKQAQKHEMSYAASWSDKMAIHLEIREISNYLETNDYVLDIGCANGYSTIQYALKKDITIIGVDFVSEMIESAKSALGGHENKLINRVKFAVGNVLDLNYEPETFDKVIATRLLINLGDWQQQLKGIKACVNVLKKDGILLLSEGTIQGWKKLNSLRTEWGLEALPMNPFNQYIDQNKLIESISSYMELIDIINFSSTYYIGTRVLRPLLAKALDMNIDYTNHNMEINRLFSLLPAYGDYGTEKLFVLRKVNL